jgi:hypothetical protein
MSALGLRQCCGNAAQIHIHKAAGIHLIGLHEKKSGTFIRVSILVKTQSSLHETQQQLAADGSTNHKATLKSSHRSPNTDVALMATSQNVQSIQRALRTAAGHCCLMCRNRVWHNIALLQQRQRHIILTPTPPNMLANHTTPTPPVPALNTHA